jgi:hypothetical protein
MRWSKVLVSGFSWLCLFSSPNVSWAQIDKGLADRLRTEGISGWVRLEAATRNIECIYKEEHVVPNQKPGFATCELKYKDGPFIIKRTKVGDDVYGRNDRYGFEIARSKQTDPWVIHAIDREPGGASALGDESYGSFLREPWCVFAVPMRAIVEDPTFTIKRIDSVGRNGQALVEMEFAIQSSNQGVADLSILIGGTVAFSPKQSWAIQEYQVRFLRRQSHQNTGKSVVVKIRYTDADSEVPKLKTVDYSLVGSGTPYASWKIEFLKFGVCDAPASDFTLTAYGLPEPGEISGRRNYGLWLTSVALVCAILALVIRRIGKLRARS